MMNHFKVKSSSTSSSSLVGTPGTPEKGPPEIQRTLHVIHSNALLTMNCKKKNQNPAVEFLLKSDDEYGNGDNNANPILSLGSLRNGNFSAGITLNKFPSGGDLIIRVSGYTLDFFWLAQRPKSSRRGSSIYNTKPVHCNNVDLPMYVDPHNLQFNLDHETRITVSGKTKGFLARRKSISTDDLAINNKLFLKTPKSGKQNKTIKKKSVVDGTKEADSRERSHTR